MEKPLSNFSRSRKMKFIFRSSFLVFFSMFLLTYAVFAKASTFSLEEYEVKAAFLYQFTKFIQWSKNSPKDEIFSICIVGKDPFGQIINELESETVDNRKIEIKRLKFEDVIDSCHVVFIGQTERNRLFSFMENLRGKGILTVSEIDGFIERGGVINFKRQGSRVGFEINQKKAEEEGIKISSKLLSLALEVIS